MNHARLNKEQAAQHGAESSNANPGGRAQSPVAEYMKPVAEPFDPAQENQ